MTVELVAPALAAVVLDVIAARMPLSTLRPPVAVAGFTCLAVVTALAVSSSLALLSIGWIGDSLRSEGIAGWCIALATTHGQVPSSAGVVSLLLLAAGSLAGAREWRRRRPSRGGGGQAIEFVPTSEAIAYAAPGRPGRIVVSTGMLQRLDAPDRRVLLAHERSHLSHNHHAYLRLTAAVGAAIPVLRALHRANAFATERWADEDAAAEVGDRQAVARAIARAALASSGAPVTMPAMAELGVPARVHALLVPGGDRAFARRRLVALSALVAAASAAASGVQVHHLVAFARHVCGV